jgi:hypothetical protein
LPFTYDVEHHTDLLIPCRPDCAFVAACSAVGADPFEMEAAVWEDADRQKLVPFSGVIVG